MHKHSCTLRLCTHSCTCMFVISHSPAHTPVTLTFEQSCKLALNSAKRVLLHENDGDPYK